jgi:hypothetical protein
MINYYNLKNYNLYSAFNILRKRLDKKNLIIYKFIINFFFTFND